MRDRGRPGHSSFPKSVLRRPACRLLSRAARKPHRPRWQRAEKLRACLTLSECRTGVCNPAIWGMRSAAASHLCSQRSTRRPSLHPGPCCKIGASKISITFTDPRAPIPARSSPGGFRTPALTRVDKFVWAGLRNPSQEPTTRIGFKCWIGAAPCMSSRLASRGTRFASGRCLIESSLQAAHATSLLMHSWTRIRHLPLSPCGSSLRAASQAIISS